jgi:hypothetical protein
MSEKGKRSASIIVGLGTANPTSGTPESKLIQVALLLLLLLLRVRAVNAH